jgi:hypothetical protein
MTKTTVVKWFFGSLIALVAGLVLLFVAGALALANDVFIMRGPDVVGIRSGALAWTLAGMVGLAMLVALAAAAAIFVAWVGAILNTANLPSKAWCVTLLVTGVLGFVFLAAMAYVIAGPDGTKVESQPDRGFAPPLTSHAGRYAATPNASGDLGASVERRG